MSEYWLAAEMARRPEISPTARLGALISEEERMEWELEQERARGIETRERRRGVARGRGRWGGGVAGGAAGAKIGGILGFMLGGPAGAALGVKLGAAAGAGLGSYAGQKVATDPKWGPPGVRISPGAMRGFERIAPGRYYVSRGEEREREYEWGETERKRYMGEQILTNALMDALTGYQVGAYGPGILSRILGRGAAPAAEVIAAPGWGAGYEWAAPRAIPSPGGPITI